MRSQSSATWSRRYPILKYIGPITKRGKRRRRKAAKKTASVSCATATMRRAKQ
jgi:hypothetical protein